MCVQALLGFETTIAHLDGHAVPVRRRGVTPPAHVVTVPNEGMPQHNFPSQKGSLLVHIDVAFPDALTPEQATGLQSQRLVAALS